MTECRLCLGPHDVQIHDATVAIHEWWKQRLALVLEPVAASEPNFQAIAPGLAAVKTLRSPASRKKAGK